MATYKTPEELRAWSRSFYNKSQIIKRGRYNYIDPNEEKEKAESETAASEYINTESDGFNDKVSNSDASALANDIISIGNASSVRIDELLSLDSSEIDKMNQKYPSTEQQLLSAENKSSVRK